MHVVIATLIGVIAFFIGEFIRRKLGRGNEDTRKLIHAIHGLTVISWLFLANEAFIIGFEIIFFVSMFVFKVITKRWPHLLGWVYQVGRNSYGEFFYPLGVISVLLISDSMWFSVAALLQLAVADAAAAIIGKAFGGNNSYKVFGGTKSVAGTTAFVLSSAALLAVILLPTQPRGLALVLIVGGLPFVLASFENISIKGSDNLTIPLATIVVLEVLLK